MIDLHTQIFYHFKWYVLRDTGERDKIAEYVYGDIQAKTWNLVSPILRPITESLKTRLRIL